MSSRRDALSSGGHHHCVASEAGGEHGVRPYGQRAGLSTGIGVSTIYFVRTGLVFMTNIAAPNRMFGSSAAGPNRLPQTTIVGANLVFALLVQSPRHCVPSAVTSSISTGPSVGVVAGGWGSVVASGGVLACTPRAKGVKSRQKSDN